MYIRDYGEILVISKGQEAANINRSGGNS